MEKLELRRLFTLDLFMTTGGVLNISETADGIDNQTAISMVNSSTISISESADSIADTASMEDNGWTFTNNGTPTETGPIAGITSIEVDTNDGNDKLEILSSPIPIDVAPRGSNLQTIQVGAPSSPTGCQDVTGAITYNGVMSQALTLDIDDRQDTGNVDPTLTSNQILGLSPGTISFGAPMNGTGSVSEDISAGSGTSGFVVQQSIGNSTPIAYQIDSFGTGTVAVSTLNANSSLYVDSQVNGTEDVRVGAFGLMNHVLGQLTVNGNAGTASITFNDSSDPIAHTFTTKGTSGLAELDEDGTKTTTLEGTFTSFTLETGTASNTVNLGLAGIQANGLQAEVDSNGTDDTVNLLSLNTGDQITLVGGAGVDNLNMTAGGIRGSVNISNPTGTDAITIDGSTVGTGSQSVTVDSAFVNGLGSGSYLFSNVKILSVIGSSSFDNFEVFPSLTIPFTIDGGTNTGTATDRLELAAGSFAGAALSFLTGSTTAGTYTFPASQPVTFTRIGVLDPTFGNVSGIAYNAQTATALAGVTVFVDKNQNGVFDAGEPAATTAADGSYTLTGLPVGTFNLLATDAGFSLVSPISLTVTAGALSGAQNLPLVPTPAAAGPDLTVIATATAIAKAGSIKPKVVVKLTNSGTAVAASAGLQIALFASTDQALDPTDTSLITTTTPAILLNPKKSRSFTVTGLVPASLARGNYYILASVDTGNSVSETNESNNLAATKSVLLVPPLVNLTGKFGAIPKTFKKSKLLPVTLTLQNLGTINATGTIDIDLLASTDKTLDNADTTLVSGSPLTLHVAANKAQPVKFKLSLAALAAGNYYLIARINTTRSVTESDLTDNTVFTAIPIAIS